MVDIDMESTFINKKGKKRFIGIKNKRLLILSSLVIFFVVLLLFILNQQNFSQQSTARTQLNTTPSRYQRVIPDYQIKAMTNIHYGPHIDEYMDVYYPINAPEPEPGIVLFHGGAWGLDKEYRAHYTSLAKNYAAQGYVVANADYRLISNSSGQSMPWPAQIGDSQLVVRRMRQNAHSIGLNPNEICSMGDSSGALLALLVDTYTTIYPSDVASIATTFSPKVNCSVDQFGPTDLAKLYDESNPMLSNAKEAIYILMDSKIPSQAPQLYSDASPVDHISPQTGQVLIIQGTKDKTVLPDQSTELQQDLINSGVPVQYVSYTGGHEYGNITPPPSKLDIMTQINSWLQKVEPTH